MAIASTTNSVDVRPGTMKNLSFSTRLFLTVLLLFITFVSCFIFFQYNREKMYKTELLNTKLQSLNVSLYELTKYYGLSDSLIMQFAEGTETVEGIAKPRFTVIKDDGLVIYDSENKRSMDNHSDRPEIRKAMHDKSAYVISRRSDTMKRDYFYSATYFKDAGIVVRSSLPYDINLNKMLSVDIEYILVILVVTAILLLLLFRYTRNIGKVFHQLNQFFTRAKSGEDISQVNIKFPGNGLGDLARHIIELYGEIRESEEDKARLKRQLTQNISHELKTPVSTISLAAQMLKDSDITKSPDVFRHISTVINDETKRLSFLVEKVLQMSLFERQRAALKLKELDANDLIVSVANTFALKVEKYGGTLDIDLQAEDSTIYVDEMHITNVLFNLMDNAVKYRRLETPLKLMARTWNENGKLLISIEDNGIVIKKEYLKKVFERFFRVPTGNKHDVKGFGLGLAYVRKIIEDHKGSIRAESGNDNIGTKFIITLPLIKS